MLVNSEAVQETTLWGKASDIKVAFKECLDCLSYDSDNIIEVHSGIIAPLEIYQGLLS